MHFKQFNKEITFWVWDLASKSKRSIFSKHTISVTGWRQKSRNTQESLDTYLLLHQEYLLILCTYLFVMNQLEKKRRESSEVRTVCNRCNQVEVSISRSTFCTCTVVFVLPYLPYWRLCDKIFKWIFRSHCCEVFVQNPNFLLIIPSRWTEGKKKWKKLFNYSSTITESL